MSAVPQTAFSDPPVGAAEAAELFSGFESEPRLLIAVSGGPDSVTLLALLAEWARTPGRPALHAATVDHGLRSASRTEAQDVAALCDRLSVPHRILTWEGAKPRTGLQARARAARYALLAQEALRLGGAVVVTAHTRDDQAETLLMRMAHGSGPAGLAAMRPRVRKGAVTLIRPLLAIPKTRLIATARARELPFATDPSNGDPRFERVRWRALMPRLAEEGLDAERLALLARRIARLDAAAAQRAQTLLPELLLGDEPGDSLQLRFAALLNEPEEIVLRVLALALVTMDGEGAAVPRLERLEACVEALTGAARGGERMVRTLSGCVLTLGADGLLRLEREGLRRRGVHPAAS